METEWHFIVSLVIYSTFQKEKEQINFKGPLGYIASSPFRKT